MHRISRVLMFISGVLLCAAAAIIIAAVGLPDRASYSSLFLPSETRPVAPELNAVAPPFSLQSADGEDRNLLELRGQPVILNFWATWCVPCAIEMPELQTLYAEIGEHVEILGINLGEPLDAVQAWRQTYQLTFPLLLDPNMRVAALYRLRAQPSTYIITPDGIIAAAFFGPVSADTLRQALQPYLDT